MARLALFAIIEGLGFVLLVLWLSQRTLEKPLGNVPLLVGAVVTIIVGNVGVLTWVLGQVKRNARIPAGFCPKCGRDREGKKGDCPGCGEPEPHVVG